VIEDSLRIGDWRLVIGMPLRGDKSQIANPKSRMDLQSQVTD
jgi:hypothetical protein